MTDRAWLIKYTGRDGQPVEVLKKANCVAGYRDIDPNAVAVELVPRVVVTYELVERILNEYIRAQLKKHSSAVARDPESMKRALTAALEE